MCNQKLLIGLCAFCVLNSVWAADDKRGGGGPPPATVVLATAQEVMLAPSVLVPGTVVSRLQAEVPAEVEGRLVWVAETGQSVKQGEAVARLDETLHRLQVLESEAAYKREKARLVFLEQELKRTQELAADSFATKSQIEKLQSERDIAESELAVVRAKQDYAKEILARYEVKAPYDGVVTDRKRRVGEWVRSGDTVVTFSNPSRLEIETSVTEKSVALLANGEELQVQVSGVMRKATVSTIVPVGDRQSLLFQLLLRVNGDDWRAGQAVRVAVPTGRARKVLAVPRDALVLRRSGASVFVIGEDNTANKIDVTPGIAGGELIEVGGGLKAGDRVVVRGGERLRPGQPVKIAASKP